MIILLSVLLVTLIGFAAHRASLCTVAAVAEVLEGRRACLLGSFARTALWALAVSVPILWLWPERGMAVPAYTLTAAALAGGFLFGAGAALNGGCAFSTLGRLVDGELWMLATLAGFCAGAGGWTMMAERVVALPQPTAGPEPLGLVLLGALWLWCGWELRRLWRSRDRRRSWRERLGSPRYSLGAAALLLGLGSGYLYTLHGAWTYTTTLNRAAQSLFRPDSGPSGLLLGLLLALVAGMALSSWQRGGFRARLGKAEDWLRRFAGGSMMGLGGALVPGGNDELILRAIPALSPNAVPAYLALLAGVACVLLLQAGSQNYHKSGIDLKHGSRNL